MLEEHQEEKEEKLVLEDLEGRRVHPLGLS